MIFELIRSLLCPFDTLEAFVPREGKILDVGCGHGYFSTMLARRSKKRNVLGIDPSYKKILIAKQTKLKEYNLNFQQSLLKDVGGKYDCIVVIDVLYLLPNDEKRKFLNLVRHRLKKDGLLLLKVTGTKPEWMIKLLRLEERLMLFSKATFSHHNSTYFTSEKDYGKLLIETGFHIEMTTSISSTFAYPPHVVFVCKL